MKIPIEVESSEQRGTTLQNSSEQERSDCFLQLIRPRQKQSLRSCSERLPAPNYFIRGGESEIFITYCVKTQFLILPRL